MPSTTLTTTATSDPSARVATTSRTAIHPYLLAIFPVITIWAGNIREVTLREGIGVTLVAGCLAALAVAAARRVFATREQAALAVTLGAILFLSYGFVDNLNTWLSRWSPSLMLSHSVAVPIWGITLLLLLRWIGRRADMAGQLTTLANVFSGSLTAMSAYLMASAISISPWIWERPLAGELDAATTLPIQVPESAPDIYLLMFDRYASKSVLADQFGFDNQSFYRDLEDRGFEVLANSFANYPKTEIEMSAILNMRYHDERIWPKSYYRTMLKQHLVGRLLTEHGYRYYHLGNLHNGIRTNPHADVNYRFSKMPTELLENLMRMTPLAAVWPTVADAQQTLDKFEQIAAFSADSHPKFVYAHFLVPHPPWKFQRDGSLVTEEKAAQRTEAENYLDQLDFTNNRIVALVDQIRQNSSRDAIIIIQADEGPELRYAGDHDRPRSERIRQRSGILFAVHLPDRSAALAMSSCRSPVNTFRMIFREYFDADLELLEDRYSYWEPENYYGKPNLKQPCKFIDVTEIVRSD